MTTNLEKQFFDTFGIEPKRRIGLINIKEPSYPQITDRRLLELICILSGVCSPQFAFERDVDIDLKGSVLRFCMYYKNDIKHQVLRLFKED